MNEETVYDKIIKILKNNKIVAVSIIICVVIAFLIPPIKDLYETLTKETENDNQNLEKEKNLWIKTIENAQKCQEDLLNQQISGQIVSRKDKYECFKLDSLGCSNLEKIAFDSKSLISVEAANYLIEYLQSKKSNDPDKKNIYKEKINELVLHRRTLLENLNK